jgi:hypothetical protein
MRSTPLLVGIDSVLPEPVAPRTALCVGQGSAKVVPAEEPGERRLGRRRVAILTGLVERTFGGEDHRGRLDRLLVEVGRRLSADPPAPIADRLEPVPADLDIDEPVQDGQPELSQVGPPGARAGQEEGAGDDGGPLRRAGRGRRRREVGSGNGEPIHEAVGEEPPSEVARAPGHGLSASRRSSSRRARGPSRR